MLSAHADTATLCSFATFSSPGLDQFAFEFGKTTNNRQHEPTGSGGGIGPLLSKGQGT